MDHLLSMEKKDSVQRWTEAKVKEPGEKDEVFCLVLRDGSLSNVMDF